MVDPPSEQLPAMFQRMTEQARRALFFARAEVSKWGSAAVEPEHLLLGIIHEGKGPAVMFSTSIEVPFGTSTREVLIAAVEEADRLQHQEIGPEHLLLGILRVADTIPASILSTHEVTLESARERL